MIDEGHYNHLGLFVHEGKRNNVTNALVLLHWVQARQGWTLALEEVDTIHPIAWWTLNQQSQVYDPLHGDWVEPTDGGWELQGNEPSHEYPTGVQPQESGSSQQIPMSPMATNTDQMISHKGMADMANIHMEGHADATTTRIVWLWTRTTATTTLCVSTQLSQCTRRGFFDFNFQYG